ncbi:MAG: 4-hydroxythreonine-4-phosphate dehydrogenase PdxA [Candidatus Omnitrophica bacterium]|nr:4-hydroxythreonine-4-phosphate dehydrogenase PdxA [Candidatus Omnitrophota bacterium]
MSLRKIPISKSYRIKVGITLGDPSGIGPGITVKAVNKLSGIADFVVIGDSSLLKKTPGFSNLIRDKVKIVDLHNLDIKRFKAGKIKAEYGRASIEYLDKALELLKEKAIDCLVTCPISKESINLAGFNYEGHTEYFIRKMKAEQAVMMLLNKYLRISLVTRHLSLKSVPEDLKINGIYETTFTTYKSLKDIFGITHPKIILCGLNPHASDNGLFGDEEERVIKPAAKKLKSKFPGVYGPLPSDIAIYKAFKGEYDAVIAMYHDQAMIPLKITGMDSGVNITLGLNFIRTSPLHGTAFDLAAKGELASPNSLIAAIKLALKCASIQKRD